MGGGGGGGEGSQGRDADGVSQARTENFRREVKVKILLMHNQKKSKCVFMSDIEETCQTLVAQCSGRPQLWMLVFGPRLPSPSTSACPSNHGNVLN